LNQTGVSDGSLGGGENTGSEQRGAAHRMASESSGNACRGCELRRVIRAALRRFERGKEGGKAEEAGGFYRRGAGKKRQGD
jgi:hypothetical protein